MSEWECECECVISGNLANPRWRALLCQPRQSKERLRQSVALQGRIY